MSTTTPAMRASKHPALGRRTPYELSEWFSADEVDRARRYTKPLKRVRLISKALGLALSVAFVALKLGPRVVEGLGVDHWILQLVAVVFAMSLMDLIVDPWVSYWVELKHDKEWDLSTQTTKGWALDVVKGLALSTLLLSLILTPVYAVMRATPDLWWLWGAVVFLALQLLLAFVYPVLIMPVFNKFVPIPDGDLRARIDGVAERAGVSIQGSYTMDASRRTRRDNAFVAGFGKTKRVVVFDTMLDHPSHVIEQVVAHEIGHYRLKHLVKTLPSLVVITFVTFGFAHAASSWLPLLRFAGVDHISDPAAAPLFLLLFGLPFTLTRVFTAWQSRRFEREADLEALELLVDPGALVDVWRRFAPKNLMDLEPSFWARLNDSHPHVGERMVFATSWGELNAVAVQEPPPAGPAAEATTTSPDAPPSG